jgi:anti-sigma factor RsiW
MNCHDATNFLMDYVAGDLPADVAATFDRHLSACANCREFLCQYRATIVAGQRACEDAHRDARATFPADLLQAIMAAIAETGETSRNQ